ncbi:beta-(1-3)-glucosyl transferase, partial [Pseudomonas aeruginosa]
MPCHNEPPELLKQPPDALTRLAYQGYEDLVTNNNTPDPAAWHPVEPPSARRAEPFPSFHSAPLEGSKPAALNLPLGQLRANAEVVALTDANTWSTPTWPRHMCPPLGA